MKTPIELIGNTPMVEIPKENIYVKLEKYNPGRSVKDRAALGMIEAAEEKGLLKTGSTIVEPTSGNTGIAIAWIGRAKGYKVVLVMPESMSVERRQIIKAYGAELILTDAALGMKGTIDKANELIEQNGYVRLGQFDNEANPKKHYDTTGVEIINDCPTVDVFVAGVGTGGTISGVSKRLKEHNSDIISVAVEPNESAVLSGEVAGKHGIQGIGAGFVPENYDKNVVDEIIRIDTELARKTAIEVSAKIGNLIGISSGANIAAARIIAKKYPNKKIVTIAPDGGENYLSIVDFGSE